MTTGTIESLPRTRVVERHDERLATAWVRSAQPTTPPTSGTWLSHDDAPTSHQPVEGGPVLVMLTSASAPALAALVAHGRAGARVYVLAPARFSPTDPALLGCPRLLVRRVAEVPVSAVHTAGRAEVWMGAVPGGAAPWRLRLDADQAAALRQVFLRLFWHDAFDEAWTSSGRSLTFRAAAGRPFDVPEPPSNAPIRLLEGGATLDASRAGQHVLLNGGAPPSVKARRLWLRPSGSDHRSLARLVRDGAVVTWNDRDLPDLATDGRSGAILLPGTRGRLSIALSPDQATEAAARLDEPPAWSFRLDVRLGDHGSDGAQLWLDGATEPRPLAPEQRMSLPDVQATEICGMNETYPAQWPAPHPLSSTVRYRWTVLPPRVPASAKEDALVGRWREVDAAWSSRLAALAERLATTGEHRGHIGRAFARLMGALVGLQRTHEALSTEVTTLAQKRPSAAGPTQAAALLRRLAELEAQAIQLRAEQDDAEHEARVSEARAQQEAAWRSGVQAALRDLPGKRSELEALEARRPTISGELGELDAAPRPADKKTRKDLEARRHKLSDELARLDRMLARSRDELAALERQQGEPFTFEPPARLKAQRTGSGGRFVPASTSATTSVVPEEALPEVGTLRNLQGQRYLVIDAWEALGPGERAAQRIRAKLVAPEDA